MREVWTGLLDQLARLGGRPTAPTVEYNGTPCKLGLFDETAVDRDVVSVGGECVREVIAQAFVNREQRVRGDDSAP